MRSRARIPWAASHGLPVNRPDDASGRVRGGPGSVCRLLLSPLTLRPEPVASTEAARSTTSSMCCVRPAPESSSPWAEPRTTRSHHAMRRVALRPRLPDRNASRGRQYSAAALVLVAGERLKHPQEEQFIGLGHSAALVGTASHLWSAPVRPSLGEPDRRRSRCRRYVSGVGFRYLRRASSIRTT
jgi:hypothetical protein